MLNKTVDQKNDLEKQKEQQEQERKYQLEVLAEIAARVIVNNLDKEISHEED